MTTKAQPSYRSLHRIADRMAPQLRRAFLQAVAELRGRVDLRVLLRTIAQRGDLGAFWRAYEQDMMGSLRPSIRDTALDSARLAQDRLGMGGSFDLTNPRAVALIDGQAASLVQGITEESRAAIQEVLRQGFLGGADVPEMARRIRNSIGLTRQYATAVENYRRGQEASGIAPGVINRRADAYAQQLLNLRAMTIARTETILAANTGQQAIWEEARQQGLLSIDTRRLWVITPDDLLCPVCEAIADANPDGVGLNEPFRSPDLGSVMFPPAHPNCLTGETLVTSRYEITGQSDRWYDGELVVIRTAGGKELSATPNHPILTDRLWVAAGALHEGDNLVCDTFGERVRSTNNNDELMPASIEEVANALRKSGKMATREMPVSAEDFHGDGKGSEVAVIRSYGLLGNDAYATPFEPFLDTPFIGTGLDGALQLPSRGGSTKHVHALHGTAGSPMRGGNLTLPLCERHRRPLQPLGLALSPQVNTSTSQGVPEGAAPDVELLREAQDRTSGRVSLDQVVKIWTTPFAGHVYNLETSGGWYNAQGIVVHNCRCALSLVGE